MCAHIDYKNLLTSLLGSTIYPIDPYQIHRRRANDLSSTSSFVHIYILDSKASAHYRRGEFWVFEVHGLGDLYGENGFPKVSPRLEVVHVKGRGHILGNGDV
jgi:hypothetical protein